MLNKCVFTGRLTRDPEDKRQGENKMTTFSLAVNSFKRKDGTEEVLYLDCLACGRLFDVVMVNTRKGDLLTVAGRLTQRKWTGKDGVSRKDYTLIVEDVDLLPRTAEQKKRDEDEQFRKESEAIKRGIVPEDAEIDDIPF